MLLTFSVPFASLKRPALRLLAVGMCAIVVVGGVACNGLLPLLPTSTLEHIRPERAKPSDQFVATVLVSPDVSSCVMTVFAQRTQCAVETQTCRCRGRVPSDIAAGIFLVSVAAVTSGGVTTAKGELVVDGAPPTIDGSRVRILRNPMRRADELVGDSGSVVDRPLSDPLDAMIEVYGTEDIDEATPRLGAAAVNTDGSFGPIALDGTELLSPPRIFIVVTDLLGNRSVPIEVSQGRDEIGPEIDIDAASLLRRPIGQKDAVHLMPEVMVDDGGCAPARVHVYGLDQDQNVDVPLKTLVVVVNEELQVDVGTETESPATVVLVGEDKCGNRSAPRVVDDGADADLPRIDLGAIDAKISDDSARLVGAIDAVADNTSAVREVRVYVGDVVHAIVTPSVDGQFSATVPLESPGEAEGLSIVVVDKVGLLTVRVRLAALRLSSPFSALEFSSVTMPADPNGVSALGVTERERELSTELTSSLVAADGTLLVVDGAAAAPYIGWREIAMNVAPAPRVFAASAVDQRTGVLVVMGGTNAVHPELADSWVARGEVWTPIWGDPTQAPPPESGVESPGLRTRAQMAFDPGLERVVLFGGEVYGDALFLLNDTWVLDDDGWRFLSNDERPSSRSGATMVTDLARGLVVLFGGECRTGLCDDVWTLQEGVWREDEVCLTSETQRPTGRTGAQAAFDPASGKIVMFGGRDRSGLLDDTWTLDEQGWHRQVLPVSPSPRAGGMLVYDPALQHIVMYGGEGSSDAPGRFWAFVDDGWVAIDLSDHIPPQRAYGAFGTTTVPTFAFGLAANATLFQPQNDLWRGELSGTGGEVAAIEVRATLPQTTGEVIGATLGVTGGGLSPSANGFAVSTLESASDTFSTVGLSTAPSDGLQSQEFFLPLGENAADELRVVLSARGPSSDAEISSVVLDAVSIEWSVALDTLGTP